MSKYNLRVQYKGNTGYYYLDSFNGYSKDLNELLEKKQQYFENSKYFKSYIKELMESWD